MTDVGQELALGPAGFFGQFPGLCTVLFDALALSDVGQRAHEPKRFALGIVFGHHAVGFDPHPAGGGAHPVLHHRPLFVAFQQGLHGLLQLGCVVGMQARRELGDGPVSVPSDVAHQLAPARRQKHLGGRQLPVPQGQASGVHRHLQPVAGLVQRLFGQQAAVGLAVHRAAQPVEIPVLPLHLGQQLQSARLLLRQLVERSLQIQSQAVRCHGPLCVVLCSVGSG